MSSASRGSEEDSWATGTTPEVNSVYARILAQNPAIEGNVTNLATSAATIPDVHDLQVEGLLDLDPAPELVLVQVVDADMVCPATEGDFRRFETDLTALLQRIADGLPEARVFIPSYYADPATYVEALTRSERRQVGGTGPCAIIDPRGRVVAAELARLEAHRCRVQRRDRVRPCERRSLHLRRRRLHPRSSSTPRHRRRPRAHLHCRPCRSSSNSLESPAHRRTDPRRLDERSARTCRTTAGRTRMPSCVRRGAPRQLRCPCAKDE